MGPTEHVTGAERAVIKWFFGIAFLIATIFIGYSWLTRTRECGVTCEAQGFSGGSLHLNAGGRLNIGSHCVCE